MRLWDTGSWCQQPGLPEGLHYKIVIGVHFVEVGTSLDMTLDSAKMEKLKTKN